MTPFETQSADGCRLRGRVFDVPAAPRAVVSLMHGFGEHGERYVPMARHLHTHNFATISLDLRGHGRSEGKRGVCHDYEHLRADLAALLAYTREQFPDLPHILYGHSMGGGLVLNHGLTVKDSGLAAIIATAPLIELTQPPAKPLEWMVRVLRKIAPNLTLGNAVDGSAVSTLPEEQAKYKNDPLVHGKLGVGLAADMVDNGRWILENAKQWTVPLLVMHAKDDQLTSFAATETFLKSAKNCRFIPYENAAHEIHNDITRDAVHREIVSFINSAI